MIDAVLDLVPAPVAAQLGGMPRGAARAFYPYAPEENGARPGVVIVAPRPKARATDDAGGSTTADDATSNFPGEAQTLRAHTAAVERVLERFTLGMSLGPTLSHDLAMAANLHDAGKADPRFQRLLSNASPFAPVGAEPLAKSATGASPPGAWDRAACPLRGGMRRSPSGWPWSIPVFSVPTTGRSSCSW